MVNRRVVGTSESSHKELHALRALLEEAFEGRFTDEDWSHTIGGHHILSVDDGILSHAAVVERVLVAGGRAVRTGYVEGVATAPRHRSWGHASAAMREIGTIIQSDYELGALSTGSPGFYVPLGWELWRGPTYTSSPTGLLRTADEDGGVMVLRTTSTRGLGLTTALICDWRSGDVW